MTAQGNENWRTWCLSPSCTLRAGMPTEGKAAVQAEGFFQHILTSGLLSLSQRSCWCRLSCLRRLPNTEAKLQTPLSEWGPALQFISPEAGWWHKQGSHSSILPSAPALALTSAELAEGEPGRQTGESRTISCVYFFCWPSVLSWPTMWQKSLTAGTQDAPEAGPLFLGSCYPTHLLISNIYTLSLMPAPCLHKKQAHLIDHRTARLQKQTEQEMTVHITPFGRHMPLYCLKPPTDP